MLEQASHQNPPTGTTPQKRKWSYIDKWERTQSRADLLRGYRSHLAKSAVMSMDEDVSGRQPAEEKHDLVNVEEERESHVLETPETDSSRSESAWIEAKATEPEIKPEPEPDVLDTLESSSSNIKTPDVIDEPTPLPVPIVPASKPKRRESAIPTKVLPPRPTLQEKSTNIIQEPRPRVTRMTRIRR